MNSIVIEGDHEQSLTLINFRTAWTIQNFTSYCQETDQVILRSPSFFINNNLSVHLVLKMNYDPLKPDFLSIFAHFSNSNPKFNMDSITAELDFSILTSENEEYKYYYYPIYYTHKLSENVGYGRKNFSKKSLIMDPKLKLLLDDKLTIICKIRFSNSSLPMYVSLEKSSAEHKKLFENFDFYDLKLMIGSEELKVHKAILASKSPVFYAMFSHDLKEAQESKVEIKDFSFEAMKEAVHFIYTGSFINFTDHVDELLALADKYCIDDLKIMCCRYYCDNVTIENAAELLMLSDLYNVNVLKDFVKRFISANIKPVIESQTFEKVKKEIPELLLDIVLQALKNTYLETN